MSSRPIDDPLREGASRLLRASALSRRVQPLLRPATLLTLGLVAAALMPVSVVTSGPSLCPFKVLTGLPCPGCGMTRSVVTLMHGDLSASLYFHPLGILLVGFCLVLAVADGWIWWRGATPSVARSSRASLVTRLMETSAPWIALGTLTVVWLVRLPLYVAGIWVF